MATQPLAGSRVEFLNFAADRAASVMACMPGKFFLEERWRHRYRMANVAKSASPIRCH